MFFILLCTTLLLLVLTVLVKKYDAIRYYIVMAKYVRKLPGPPPTNMLMGNVSAVFDTSANIFKVLRTWGRDYYPIYQNWIAHMFVVNIVNPYDFETIMSNMKHNTKGYIYGMLDNWLATGLLTSEGKKWQERRKILTPAFHFNILQGFIKIFNEETKTLVKIFKGECHKPYIAVTDYISDFTLNAIGESAMGTRIDDNNVNAKEYKKAIYDIGKVYVYRFTRPWLLYKLFYCFVPYYYKEKKLVKTLHQFTTEVISNRERSFGIDNKGKDRLTYSKRKRLAMLDLLLTAKHEEGTIDDDGIREEVDTFMFEGHDTTSVAICFALMTIACHRKIQERIVDEIKQVVTDLDNLDYKTLQDLKYMDRCVKEILRLYPSVPFIARVLGEDITTHTGHKLKAFTMVNLHIYDLHHNPELYPDPEKFDPDRFLPENCQNRHNFAYVPFSAGPRNCIGQKFALLEIKAVLCGILSEFILEPVDTPDSIEFVADVVLRTKESIKVKFVPRVI